MVTESMTPPEQQPLKIGPPIEYDSEEYFSLSITRDVYSNYPVEIVLKNKTLGLKKHYNGNILSLFHHRLVHKTIPMFQVLS